MEIVFNRHYTKLDHVGFNEGEKMKYWRMAFRIGSQGPEMWPYCCGRGIAAIAYWFLSGEELGDLSIMPIEEYKAVWHRNWRENTAGQASLRKFRCEMEKGDIIYVKEGPYIVGKGVIKSDYKYDPEILTGCREEWEHYREVDWSRDFSKFRLVVGADQHTVLELNEERLDKIRKAESQARKDTETLEADEGEAYISEAKFRARNRALIEAKKANSDYCCEVCGMNFKKVYGKIGDGYIIAHHISPIGTRKKASKTTLDDIALVCSNCHDMLHRKKDQPTGIGELRRKYRG